MDVAKSVERWKTMLSQLPKSVTKVGCEPGDVSELHFSHAGNRLLKLMVCDPLYLRYTTTGNLIDGWIGELPGEKAEGEPVPVEVCREVINSYPAVIEWEGYPSKYRLTDAGVDYVFLNSNTEGNIGSKI